MKEIKKVNLGTFYGMKLSLEDEGSGLTESEWQKMWRDQKEREREIAVNEYKSGLFWFSSIFKNL